MDVFTAKELAKKYSQTYAQVMLKSERRLATCYFYDFSFDDENTPYADIHLVYEGGISSDIRVWLKDLVILPMPKRKVFDSQGKTFVYSRVPNRQWRKGLCSENSQLIDVTKQLLQVLPNKNAFSFNIVNGRVWSVNVTKDLFSPKYNDSFYDVITYLKREDSREISKALSEIFWVTSYISEKIPFMLYRYEVPLATYSDKTDTFTLLSKLYMQELLDFCTRFKLTSKIEV